MHALTPMQNQNSQASTLRARAGRSRHVSDLAGGRKGGVGTGIGASILRIGTGMAASRTDPCQSSTDGSMTVLHMASQ
jgi:hypothetical protein